MQLKINLSNLVHSDQNIYLKTQLLTFEIANLYLQFLRPFAPKMSINFYSWCRHVPKWDKLRSRLLVEHGWNGASRWNVVVAHLRHPRNWNLTLKKTLHHLQRSYAEKIYQNQRISWQWMQLSSPFEVCTCYTCIYNESEWLSNLPYSKNVYYNFNCFFLFLSSYT